MAEPLARFLLDDPKNLGDIFSFVYLFSRHAFTALRLSGCWILYQQASSGGRLRSKVIKTNKQSWQY